MNESFALFENETDFLSLLIVGTNHTLNKRSHTIVVRSLNCLLFDRLVSQLNTKDRRTHSVPWKIYCVFEKWKMCSLHFASTDCVRWNSRCQRTTKRNLKLDFRMYVARCTHDFDECITMEDELFSANGMLVAVCTCDLPHWKCIHQQVVCLNSVNTMSRMFEPISSIFLVPFPLINVSIHMWSQLYI